MDPNAVLALIGDLYSQVSRLTAENAALKQEAERARTDRSAATS